jgi:hypothetical protein
MKTQKRGSLTGLILIALAALSNVCAQDMPAAYRDVLTRLGRKGDFADRVLKVGIPRNDLNITIAGIKTPTAFGFGGWLGFTPGDGGLDVMMGDLVLLQEEVNPVMSALLENGLEVTALHNHFFWDDPHVYYMHVHGHGKASDLAQEVKPALDLIGHVQAKELSEGLQAQGAKPAPGSVRTLEGNLNRDELDRIIGHKGDVIGPVHKYTIGRDDLHVNEMGAVINARMGLNTWAAFIGADESAAVAGDVAMLEQEVTPVLTALRKNGLDVVAIHHHMTGTKPMIIFLHYWGTGPAATLASGFRAALDELTKHHGHPDTDARDNMKEMHK